VEERVGEGEGIGEREAEAQYHHTNVTRVIRSEDCLEEIGTRQTKSQSGEQYRSDGERRRVAGAVRCLECISTALAHSLHLHSMEPLCSLKAPRGLRAIIVNSV